MALKMLQFCAIVLTALALVPAGAHLFELPNKIGLPQDRYFAVQAIYRGWALFGFVLLPAIAANVALSFVLRRRGHGAAFWLAALASLGMTASLAVFFIWTYLANRATANWTAAPAADHDAVCAVRGECGDVVSSGFPRTRNRAIGWPPPRSG